MAIDISCEEEIDLLEGHLIHLQRFLSGNPGRNELDEEVDFDRLTDEWSDVYDMRILELEKETSSQSGNDYRFKGLLSRYKEIHNKVKREYDISLYRGFENKNSNLRDHHFSSYSPEKGIFEEVFFRDGKIEFPDYLSDI